MQHASTHCNTINHTALHCNALQHTASHCITLQHTATHCTTLQHIAPHCTTLHHTATHCSTLHHTTPHCTKLHRTAPHRTTLHHTATHYTTLQHTTPHYTTLQHIRRAQPNKSQPPVRDSYTHFMTHIHHTASHYNTLQHTRHTQPKPTGVCHCLRIVEFRDSAHKQTTPATATARSCNTRRVSSRATRGGGAKGTHHAGKLGRRERATRTCTPRVGGNASGDAREGAE